MGGITLLDVKADYIATVVKIMQFCRELDTQTIAIE